VLSPSQASLLRLISIGDEDSIRHALSGTSPTPVALDERTAALVRLASLISRDSALPAYQRTVQAALDAGATVDEILSLLVVLAEPAGSTAVITAAPKLAMALGYDVEAGLEELAT
jgi:alkylhydroperoxidase/carboxymuconolactone decarboxylase family protein YurZ